MELRHLETLLAIAEEGRSPPPPTRSRPCSRTCPTRCASSKPSSACRCSCAAARGPSPRSSASLVLDRARRVNRELEAMRADLALLQGLEAGYAPPRCGRYREPLAGARAGRRPARPRARSAAPRQRGCVGTALHRARRRRARAGRRHRAGRRPPARGRAPARGGRSSVSSAAMSSCRREPVPLAAFAKLPLVLPPEPNPLRIEVDRAAEAHGDHPDRAGRGRGHPAHRRPRGGRRLRVDPPRDRHPARAAPRPHGHASPACRRVGWQWSSARDAQLSLADQAVRDSVRSLVREARAFAREQPGRKKVPVAARRGGRSMAANPRTRRRPQGQRQAHPRRTARCAARGVRTAEHPRGGRRLALRHRERTDDPGDRDLGAAGLRDRVPRARPLAARND